MKPVGVGDIVFDMGDLNEGQAMSHLLKYRKTIGSLLATFAFVLQWAFLDQLKEDQQRIFWKPQASFTMLEVYALEGLYHHTKDKEFLRRAITTDSTYYIGEMGSPAYNKSTEDQRRGYVQKALDAKPGDWSEYQTAKSQLHRDMGSLYSEWRVGALRIETQVRALRILIFTLSLAGLLLIWSAEAFPKRHSDSGP